MTNKNKKSILIISNGLIIGGIERSLVDFLRHFDYSMYDICLLLLDGEGMYTSEVPSEVRVVICNMNAVYGPLVATLYKNFIHGKFWNVWCRIVLCIGGIKRLSWAIPILRQHYDTAIAYRPGIYTSILADAVKSSNKIGWWHHGEMVFGTNERYRLSKEYSKFQHIIAVSDYCRTMLCNSFAISLDRIAVIPNMICADSIRAKSNEACDISFLSDKTFHIISVGRLSHEKNMSFCVKVAKELRSIAIPFEWRLVGDGPECSTIKDDIKEAQLEECIRLTGGLTNPYSLMKNSDLLFHPSLVESQGLVLLEAMTLGVPVVSVRSAGPLEFIRNGENGLLIDDNVHEAVDAIIRVYRDKSLASKMVLEAKATVLNYRPESIIKKVSEIITHYE